MSIKKVCVFCGSSPGSREEYIAAARELGRELVNRELGLVYGGASVGLMGSLARTVLDLGGEVTGVMPAALIDKEVALDVLPDLRVVNSMHERKALMADLSDGFVALPGGLGTIEEFFEVLTWAQLEIHDKPCGLLNVCGYFDKIVDFLDGAVGEEFIRSEHRSMVLIHENPAALLSALDDYEPPKIDKAKWILSLKKA